MLLIDEVTRPIPPEAVILLVAVSAGLLPTPDRGDCAGYLEKSRIAEAIAQA